MSFFEGTVVRNFHIAMSGANDFVEIEKRAARMERPRHSVPILARRLGAKLYQTNLDASPYSSSDKLRSRLLGSPQGWSLARAMAPQLGPNDVIFCLDTEVGVPIAAMLRGKPDRPKLVVYLHNLDRPRGWLGTKLFGIADSVDLFTSCCSSQLEFVRDRFNVGEDRTLLLLQHVDNKFYTRGQPTASKRRPLIASVGLERRDYVTLAAAVKDLDADVRVDAWSPNARKMAKTFPSVLPPNMEYCTGTPAELVQLYRNADVVVVSTFPNKYAGLTTLVEALACARPVVASRTVGLADYPASQRDYDGEAVRRQGHAGRNYLVARKSGKRDGSGSAGL
ncbi:glycosyltransferase [Bradyrhizobium lablabi]|uniref:glycosyltransferase n=1 Tax=Bradyrhizobium lablabi TaxID=722472 RepID=UPI0012E38333|nr:glycosyltransferase [Bradyrhizobium lablabi]